MNPTPPSDEGSARERAAVPAGGSPISSPPPEAAAVVLAGGASRRMGRPKPFLSVGGRELLERALDAAAGACSTVVLVGSDADGCGRAALRYGWRGIPGESEAAPRRFRRGPTALHLVTDRRPGQGPLAGLETAWTASPPGVTRWWALAADLPFASAALGRRLLAALREWEAEGPGSGAAPGGTETAPAARAVVSAAGRSQPLCAAYGAGALPVATRALDGGTRAMSAFLDRLLVRTLEIGRADGPLLLNVNTRVDLEAARALARGGSREWWADRRAEGCGGE